MANKYMTTYFKIRSVFERLCTVRSSTYKSQVLRELRDSLRSQARIRLLWKLLCVNKYKYL